MSVDHRSASRRRPGRARSRHRRPDGNLREALIEAGIALLLEGGRSSLTLRRAAARAGVSHAAPAHHFAGLPGLLTAIAARAFERFSAMMTAGRKAAGPRPFDQVLGVCQGYLKFAARHEALFQIMFTTVEVDRCDPEMEAAAAQAYGILREVCLPFAKGKTPDQVLEHAVWSMVHGYALLGFNRAATAPSPRQAAPAFEHHLRRLLRP